MINTGLQKHRRSLLIASAAAAAGWLTGCASTRANTPRQALTWTGRLGLVVESDPPQSFAGGFELTGSATTGALSLFNPLGNQVARMQWSPTEVTLADGQTVRQFTSLAALTEQTTGAALPVQALFQWLQGHPSQADGWDVDLSGFGDGKLLARRKNPQPTAILRIALDP